MKVDKYQKTLLIFTAIALIPIALSYGIVPEKTLTGLYGFPVEDINLSHIFRAQMGLLLGQAIFYFWGAFNPNLRRPALYALVIFMLGLAVGRVFSLIIDGIPEFGLIFSLIAEIIMGSIGLILLREDKSFK
jgi:hypothetical protein